MGEHHPPVQIPEICQALGVEDIHRVDPYDYEETLGALTQAIEFEGVSVVILNQRCCMFPKKIREEPYRVLSDVCTGCGQCLDMYCPAIIVSKEKTARGKERAAIDPFMCVGCSFCAQICPVNAIVCG